MVRVVTYEEIVEISKNGGAVLIDVREPKEIQDSGLIPSSINIPMNSVYEELQKDDEYFSSKYKVDKPKNDSYIVITCRSGRRAKIVMQELEEHGYKKVKYYAGSWLEWESKNKE